VASTNQGINNLSKRITDRIINAKRDAPMIIHFFIRFFIKNKNTKWSTL
jgi:hypothetical protein